MAVIKPMIRSNICINAHPIGCARDTEHQIEYAKEQNCTAKIIIGGAVITQSFADEIGADGYSKDAAEACRVVERLLTE